jgi:hypothetical protein
MAYKAAVHATNITKRLMYIVSSLQVASMIFGGKQSKGQITGLQLLEVNLAEG